MQQTTGRVQPSKGEVAFRFFAGTAIALALYYTPELRWTSTAPDAAMAQVDGLLRKPAQAVSDASCLSGDDRGFVIDAALKAN